MPSNDVAVSVRGLSKSYSIAKNAAKHTTAGEALMHKLRHPFAREERETFWALNDVSFDIQKGDVVGIIGRNGAGKSTLLKILSRITQPTRGRIDLYGRVGSLLEVGTGFHPELTGRENIFLNGAILGMSRAEIVRQFDAIVEFSEIESFLDTPVKRYSSGMSVRLAFAVAAHLNPEILLIDEVLAVGDLQFQKKCLGKIAQVSHEGRTVVFVSHDMRAVRNLCQTGIYLKHGQMLASVPVEEAISLYIKDTVDSSLHLPVAVKDLVVHGFDISQNETRTTHIDGSYDFSIQVEFELLRDYTLFRLGIYLKTLLGDTVTRSFVADWNPDYENLAAGRYRSVLRIPKNLMVQGTYRIVLHASRYGVESYLDRSGLEQEIMVTAPTGFNEAHIGEPHFDCMFLVEDGWSLAKEDTFEHYHKSHHGTFATARAQTV